MVSKSNFKLTICFNDPALDEEERDRDVQNLLVQLRDIDEVEIVDRVADPAPPEGSKPLFSFLTGLLTAEVNPSNFKALINFLGDRLSGKVIDLKVEANGKKLEVKANSQEELMAAIRAAQEFVES
ncbi:MAG: hypothetical protein F6K19_40640 [Cyanothece sp. SIO1E1]|nr:hypothetical protein [Cyanothece sp. SIO1E1]